MVPNHARYQLRYTRMCNMAIIRTFPHAVKSENGSFFKFFCADGLRYRCACAGGLSFYLDFTKDSFRILQRAGMLRTVEQKKSKSNVK